MVTHKLTTATIAAGLSLSLLAQQATGAEAPALRKASQATVAAAEAEQFRNEIETYVRELSKQMRDELRREFNTQVVLASNELRTRG